MGADWSADELTVMQFDDELEIAAPRRDGTFGGYVPIWVVRSGAGIYVRTWYRRDTGWFGRAVRAGMARVRLGEVVVDVIVDDVAADAEPRLAVDDAYRAKYGRFGSAAERMVSAEAAQTTLRLTPRQ